MVVTPSRTVTRKRHLAKGDYQQTSGQRSEKRIPTGKLFGLRKFDLVATPKGVGIVKVRTHLRHLIESCACCAHNKEILSRELVNEFDLFRVFNHGAVLVLVYCCR